MMKSFDKSIQEKMPKRVSCTPKILKDRSFMDSRRSPAVSTSKDHSIEVVESHLMLNNFNGPLNRLTS